MKRCLFLVGTSGLALMDWADPLACMAAESILAFDPSYSKLPTLEQQTKDRLPTGAGGPNQAADGGRSAGHRAASPPGQGRRGDRQPN